MQGDRGPIGGVGRPIQRPITRVSAASVLRRGGQLSPSGATRTQQIAFCRGCAAPPKIPVWPFLRLPYVVHLLSDKVFPLPADAVCVAAAGSEPRLGLSLAVDPRELGHRGPRKSARGPLVLHHPLKR